MSFDRFERTFMRFSVLRDVGGETQLATHGSGDIGSDFQKGVYIAPITEKLSCNPTCVPMHTFTLTYVSNNLC